MERVGGVAAVGDRIGQGAEHVEELDDRAGPAVGDDERHRVGFGRAGVDEVDVEVVDARRELRPHVHPFLGGAEVVLVAPVLRQVLHERERDALRPVVDRLALGPARVPQTRRADRRSRRRSNATWNGTMSESGTGPPSAPNTTQVTPSRRKVSWSVSAAARRGMWINTTARELMRVMTQRKYP